MPTVALRTIELSEPHVRIVLSGEELPLLKREGNTGYTCGGCGALLVEDVWLWEIRNVVFHCPSCSAYNEVDN